ncbi:MAG TPA: restriction endonuclease subunit S [Brevundimonas sp.]
MPSEVPDGWRAVALGDVIRLEYGRALAASAREAGSVPVYGSNGICGQHSTALVNERAIVVGRKGTAGSVTVTSGPFWPIDTTYFVVPRVEADFDWLAATLEHARLPELNEATGVPGLNRDKAYLQPILLPPVDEQRRIAEVLRSVDHQTDLTKRTLAATSAAKNATLIAILHSNSWPYVRVGDLLAPTQTPMRSGPFGSALLKSELADSGVPLLGIDNVHVERFVPEYRRFISDAKYEELARYTVFPNDVMVTIMGTVGRCCVVPQGIGRAISSKHVWTLTLDEQKYSPAFLAWQINHEPRVLNQLRGSAQGGIMSAISSETLRNLLVPAPPQSLMLELDRLIISANSTLCRLEEELAGLKRLKRLVAGDLLSGRVRVPA